tara:strand:- start:898 stop:2598 length:1701 start_codon:yes stop_codon:yes gene_type:complete
MENVPLSITKTGGDAVILSAVLPSNIFTRDDVKRERSPAENDEREREAKKLKVDNTKLRRLLVETKESLELMRATEAATQAERTELQDQLEKLKEDLALTRRQISAQEHVDKCAMCLDEFTVNDKRAIKVPTCVHSFCVGCLDQQLQQDDNQQKCPVCRIPYDGQLEIDVNRRLVELNESSSSSNSVSASSSSVSASSSSVSASSSSSSSSSSSVSASSNNSVPPDCVRVTKNFKMPYEGSPGWKNAIPLTVLLKDKWGAEYESSVILLINVENFFEESRRRQPTRNFRFMGFTVKVNNRTILFDNCHGQLKERLTLLCKVLLGCAVASLPGILDIFRHYLFNVQFSNSGNLRQLKKTFITKAAYNRFSMNKQLQNTDNTWINNNTTFRNNEQRLPGAAWPLVQKVFGDTVENVFTFPLVFDDIGSTLESLNDDLFFKAIDFPNECIKPNRRKQSSVYENIRYRVGATTGVEPEIEHYSYENNGCLLLCVVNKTSNDRNLIEPNGFQLYTNCSSRNVICKGSINTKKVYGIRLTDDFSSGMESVIEIAPMDERALCMNLYGKHMED